MIRATDRGDANIRPPVEAPVEGVVHRDASRPPAGDTLELTLNGLSPRLREALAIPVVRPLKEGVGELVAARTAAASVP